MMTVLQEGGSISHDSLWGIVGAVVPISQRRCMTNRVQGILLFFFSHSRLNPSAQEAGGT